MLFSLIACSNSDENEETYEDHEGYSEENQEVYDEFASSDYSPENIRFLLESENGLFATHSHSVGFEILDIEQKNDNTFYVSTDKRNLHIELGKTIKDDGSTSLAYIVYDWDTSAYIEESKGWYESHK